jgi:hypothetical protein
MLTIRLEMRLEMAETRCQMRATVAEMRGRSNGLFLLWRAQKGYAGRHGSFLHKD